MFDLKSQVIENYTVSDGLLDNFVECIDVDINDNIWFGTSVGVQMYDGVNWITYNQASFPGMLSDNIKCVKATSNGDIWVGTDYGVNQLVSGVSGLMWLSYTTSNGLINNQIKSIDESPNGDVWVGTNQGVSYFNGTSWTSYSSPDIHWSGVNATAFDSNGDKWFASPLGGITHFDGINFTVYDTAFGLLTQNVTDLIIDNYDNKWIGTGAGISVLDELNSEISHHTRMYIMPPPDTLNPVVSVVSNSNGIMWSAIYVGYLAEGGVAYWNGIQWQDIDFSDGLAGQNIKGIAIDSEGNVWVATTTGVSKISAVLNNISDILEIDNFLYPNPTSGKINIKLDEGTDNIYVYNSLGCLVLSKKLSDKLLLELDISHFLDGVYYVVIDYDKTSVRKKIVVDQKY